MKSVSTGKNVAWAQKYFFSEILCTKFSNDVMPTPISCLNTLNTQAFEPIYISF
jgi:hypothetical protein